MHIVFNLWQKRHVHFLFVCLFQFRHMIIVPMLDVEMASDENAVSNYYCVTTIATEFRAEEQHVSIFGNVRHVDRYSEGHCFRIASCHCRRVVVVVLLILYAT